MTTASRPRVSALVTTYNHEPYIGSALESLLLQDDVDMEIIVVDDGSADRTFTIMSEYEKHGVKCLRTTNQGPSHAMNLAMSQATGDVFLLQSGDDISMPGRAAQQASQLREGFAIVGSVPKLIDKHGSDLPQSAFPAFTQREEFASADANAQLKSLFYKGNCICAPAIAMTRDTWRKIGAFHPGLLQLQDYDYWLRATAAGLAIAISVDPSAMYRVHDKNLSSMANIVRSDRELIRILREVPNGLTSAALLDILYGASEAAAEPNVSTAALLPMLYLRHSHPQVRQLGYERLIDVLADPALEQAFHAAFGTNRRTVFDLLLN
jgi:glycosyltransferase involved in cell wall biosynthesis